VKEGRGEEAAAAAATATGVEKVEQAKTDAMPCSCCWKESNCICHMSIRTTIIMNSSKTTQDYCQYASQ
jgi:hypothetical protein